MLLQILQTQRTLYKPTNGLSVDTGSKCLIHTVQVLQSVSENWLANLKHHSKLIFGVFCNFLLPDELASFVLDFVQCVAIAQT